MIEYKINIFKYYNRNNKHSLKDNNNKKNFKY